MNIGARRDGDVHGDLGKVRWLRPLGPTPPTLAPVATSEYTAATPTEVGSRAPVANVGPEGDGSRPEIA